MALSGCYALLKYIVVIVNIIFWLAGVAVLTLAVWMLTDPTMYVSIAQDEANYYTGIYILLAAGALMFIVGFLGCCGALRESPCMLVTFFCFLLMILVVEIAAGCWIYTNRYELERMLNENVKLTVQKEYGVIDSRTIAFDTIQKHLKCCGATGPADWSGAQFNKKSGGASGTLNLDIGSGMKTYELPLSCCSTPDSPIVCKGAAKIPLSGKASGSIMYQEGCITKLKEVLSDHMIIGWALLIGIAVIELLGLIFSLVLCCAEKREQSLVKMRRQRQMDKDSIESIRA